MEQDLNKVKGLAWFRENRPALAWAVLALSLLSTLLIWQLARRHTERAGAEYFRFRAQQIQRAIAQRMAAYEEILRGAQGLFAASRKVQRSEWKAYVGRLHLAQRFPGIRALGYASYVADAGPHPVAPVTLLEPRRRNVEEYGADLFHDPVQRRAMQRARANGDAALTGRVTLPENAAKGREPGFIMFLPIDDHSGALSRDGRREVVRGFVFATFVARDLMQGILGVEAPRVRLQIFDGSRAARPTLLYDSGAISADSPPPDVRGRFVRVRHVAVSGRPWTLRFSDLPAFDAVVDHKMPTVVLTGGVIVSLLLFFVVRNLATTQRRALEAAAEMTTALRASEERFRLLVGGIEDYAIFMLDPDGRIISWNSGAQRLKGYSADEVLGRHFSIFYGSRDRSSGVPEAALRQAAERGSCEMEGWRLRKDRSAFWASALITALRDERGALKGFAKITRDMTERKQAETEVRELNGRLEHHVNELTVVNAELEAFSYSVSHDLRAPLRAMDGFSNALLKHHSEHLNAQARNYLGRIRAASQRMGELIDDLLRLSRVTRAELSPQTVDLSQIAREVVDELQRGQPERQVQVSIEPGLSADADLALMRAVLQNLLGNAWKFTAGSRPARIEFGRAQNDRDDVFFVRDNGAGFDAAYGDKLFTPFQRLHSAAEFSGTGIGLSIVQRAVRRHGGAVWAEGAPGKGATFYFSLPIRHGGEHEPITHHSAGGGQSGRRGIDAHGAA